MKNESKVLYLRDLFCDLFLSLIVLSFHVIGMHILTRMPTFGKFEPVRFVTGSRDMFDKVLTSVRNYFAQKPAVIAEWEEWNSKVIPKTDDSAAYVAL